MANDMMDTKKQRRGWLPLRILRFRRKSDGGATVEFVILFPIFFFIFLATLELGMHMVREVMLERGLDISVRALRLGQLPITQNNAANHDMLKKEVCNNTGIISDCLDTLTLELEPISTTTWAMPAKSAKCTDRGTQIAPVTTFNAGQQNQMVLIRACLLVRPFIYSPFLNLGMPLIDGTNGKRYAIVATSAYVNEPASNSSGSSSTSGSASSP